MGGPIIAVATLLERSVLNTSFVVVTIAVVIFMLFGAWKAFQSHKQRPTTGKEGLIGRSGIAITDLDPEGQVELQGEIWRATAVDGSLPKDSRVVVVDERGLTLLVRAA